ncbi:MAG TPA: hypothetical protein VHA73_14420 [Acidimicrobiales bacterium]|nr:hypothetical protein [Acidimicrobiales bacterium]
MNRCHPAPLDLRPAFAVALGLRTFMPEDEGNGGPSPADESGDVVPPDDAAGEGDEQEPAELTDDEAKVPRIKQLSDEAAKHRRLRKEAEKREQALAERVAELEKATADEATLAENRSLKLELAWERATRNVAWTENGAEGAWKLAHDDLGKALKDDGTVDATTVGQVVTSVVDRYPAFVQQESEEAPPADAFPNSRPSGPATNGKKKSTGPAGDRAVLERKFPALRGRR